jgi:sec-independent protein translocase protein TatA
MFGGPEGVIILVLVLVLFGGSQLPKLARNLGQAQKEFRTAMDESNQPSPPGSLPAPSPTAVPQAGPSSDVAGSD